MSTTDAVLCAGLIWLITVIILVAVVYKLQIEPMIKRRKQ